MNVDEPRGRLGPQGDVERREGQLANGGDRPAANATELGLINAAKALTSKLDVPGVCAAVLEAAEQVFGATSTWILLHEPENNVLQTQLFRGPGSTVFAHLVLPADDQSLSGLVFTTRQVEFVPDVRKERRWFNPERVHASGLRSVFMLPLVFENTGLGVVGLDSPRFTADHPPEAADVARLQALAAHAAIGITNARLYEASERERRRLRALLEERRQLRGQVTHLRDEIRQAHGVGDVIGTSPPFKDVLRQAELVASATTTVLLLGETGTGKELLARRIHDQSDRAACPFVAVNCAALPEALVESELFGHEKGAFTGALARKPGKFELAHRGTIFLDEVGDLPLEAQAKLLRVLQDGQVQRVGSTQATPVDVRVLAATNQDLDTAIAAKTFRSDLFYRLSVSDPDSSIARPPRRYSATRRSLCAAIRREAA